MNNPGSTVELEFLQDWPQGRMLMGDVGLYGLGVADQLIRRRLAKTVPAAKPSRARSTRKATRSHEKDINHNAAGRRSGDTAVT